MIFHEGVKILIFDHLTPINEVTEENTDKTNINFYILIIRGPSSVFAKDVIIILNTQYLLMKSVELQTDYD